MSAVEKTANPLVVFNDQLQSRKDQFAAALPAHIPVERFCRVILTAVQMDPKLLNVERRSLFNAAIKAATDGLLPDGREAALVIYRDKTRGEIAQYMPMIAGVRKKVRNSGEIATWDAQVVYANDEFAYELGDEPFIKHKPALGDRGKPIAAYSIATLKSGEKSREVMTIGEIERVRSISRAKDSGPWVSHYAEMCRKTVARRHSKVLPMSTDLDDLIRKDDALYDLQSAGDAARALPERKLTLTGRLDALAGPTPDLPAHDAETGEVIDNDPPAEAGNEAPAAESAQPTATQARSNPPASRSGEAGGDNGTPPATAAKAAGKPASAAEKKPTPDKAQTLTPHERGRDARETGRSRKAVPPEWRTEDFAGEAEAWLAGWDERDAELAGAAAGEGS